MIQSITATSSWTKRFTAYLNERFPLLNGLLFFIFYLTAFTYTSFLANPVSPVFFSVKVILGFLAVYSFFFRLRVFDEHKDYEKDCLNYPGRVLQSGLITLAQLRNIAVAGTLIEAIISIWFSWQVFGWWALAFTYSLLMAKEFFVGEWLEKRLFLYAISHLLIMPLLVIWVGSMADPTGILPVEVVYLGFLSFFSGVAFEVSRKIKSPKDEIPSIQTYSQLFGPVKAASIALGALLIASLLMFVLLSFIQVGWIFYAGIVLLFGCCMALFLPFIRNPHTANPKKLELASSCYMLAAYLLIIIATLLQTGLTWSQP